MLLFQSSEFVFKLKSTSVVSPVESVSAAVVDATSAANATMTDLATRSCCYNHSSYFFSFFDNGNWVIKLDSNHLISCLGYDT